jgi:hypothetical protein
MKRATQNTLLLLTATLFFLSAGVRAQWTKLEPFTKLTDRYSWLAGYGDCALPVGNGRIYYSQNGSSSPSSGTWGVLGLTTDDGLSAGVVAENSRDGGYFNLIMHDDNTISWTQDGGMRTKYVSADGFKTSTVVSGGQIDVTATTPNYFYSPTHYYADTLNMLRYMRPPASYTAYVNLKVPKFNIFSTHMKFTNDSTGYMLAVPAGSTICTTLLKTVSSGVSWSPLFTSADDALADMEIMNGNMYVMTHGGKLYKAALTGGTFTLQSSLPYGGVLFLAARKSGGGFLCGGKTGMLFKSSDSGATWSEENSNTSEDIKAGYLFDDAAYFVTSKNTVYKSSPPNQLRYRFTKGSTTVRPNPTAGKTELAISDAHKAFFSTVRLTLTDMSGSTIISRPAVDAAELLDLTFLPAGVYNLSVESLVATERIRIVKLD